MDVGTFPGFYLFPSEFLSVRVIPSSREAGTQRVVVRFTPAVRPSSRATHTVLTPCRAGGNCEVGEVPLAL